MDDCGKSANGLQIRINEPMVSMGNKALDLLIDLLAQLCPDIVSQEPDLPGKLGFEGLLQLLWHVLHASQIPKVGHECVFAARMRGHDIVG